MASPSDLVALVARLRYAASLDHKNYTGGGLAEAAAAIEQLQAELADCHRVITIWDASDLKARPAVEQYARAERAETEAESLRAELAAMTKTKDAAYEERNRCVALAARMAQRMNLRAGLAVTAIEGWSEDWHGLVHIQLPTGQVSWHFHDSQRALFHDLLTLPFQWDGHTTEEKYRRVDQAFVPVLTRGADAARAQAGGK